MKRSAWIAASVALSLSAAPAVAAGGGSFAGKTADGHPVAFRAGKSQVMAFAFQSRFQCADGTTFVARASYRSIKRRGARFSAAFANPDRSIQTTVRGTIHAKKASGSISRRATFNAQRKLDPKGSLVCTSRTSWSARGR